jgi:glutamate-1-semialdehyde 2,1-aminomutase
MYDRALASLPGGNTRTTVFMKPYPIYAARGEGCRVWDLDGNVYIDCINNFTSQIHGHAHPALIKARPRSSRWARRSACRRNPRSISPSCWFAPAVGRSGTFRQFRHRSRDDGAEGGAGAYRPSKIAKCEGAYHGSYDYAEVSLDPTPEAWGRNAPVSVAYAKGTPDNVLADVVTIPFNDAEAGRQPDPRARA